MILPPAPPFLFDEYKKVREGIEETEEIGEMSTRERYAAELNEAKREYELRKKKQQVS